MELINTIFSGPFFQISSDGGHAAEHRRFADAVQPTNQRGPRLLPRDQRAAAGPFKGVAT
jgi:hypothetical protein